MGPFTVTGLKPALESLTAIFGRVKIELSGLYGILQTEGMLNARLTKIRQKDGSIKVGPGISKHAWGTAIDIKLAGILNKQGDDLVERGLLVLSSYFNSAGWYWGAAFNVEDGMHFEVSRSLLDSWVKAGSV